MSDWPLAIPPAVETEFKFRILKKSDWPNREVLGMIVRCGEQFSLKLKLKILIHF